MRAAKTLIRLVGIRPGWSKSSLGTHAILLVLSWGGSNVLFYSPNFTVCFKCDHHHHTTSSVCHFVRLSNNSVITYCFYLPLHSRAPQSWQYSSSSHYKILLNPAVLSSIISSFHVYLEKSIFLHPCNRSFLSNSFARAGICGKSGGCIYTRIGGWCGRETCNYDRHYVWIDIKYLEVLLMSN